jgi:hypothetical protein
MPGVATTLPALIVAAVVVTFLALHAPMTRVDRLVLLGTLYAAYSTLLFLLHFVIKTAAWAFKRHSGARSARRLRPEHLLAGVLLLLNQVLVLTGFKDVGFSWEVVLGVLSLLAATALALALAARIDAGMRSIGGGGVGGQGALPMIAALSISVCLLPRDHSQGTAEANGAPSVVGSGERVPHPLVLIGLDGVDAKLLRGAMKVVDLGALQAFMSEGFVGSLDNLDFGFSPQVWTTIATGQGRDDHLIYAFETRRSPLFQRPLDSWWAQIPPGYAITSVLNAGEYAGLVTRRATNGADRRGPSIWQILSRHGYENLVVDYLISFPAEKIRGYFLTDAAYGTPALATDEKGMGQAVALLREGAEYPAGTWPPRFATMDLPEAAGGDQILGPAEREFVNASLMFERAAASRPFDFMTFYTHWSDTFNHQLSAGEYDEMIRGDFSSSGAKRFLACYRRLDGFLARLRRDFPQANILVVSDHGVGTGFKYRKRVLQHVKGCPGIFMAHGPDIRGGDGAQHVISMYDIAPTVLAYFGAPVPEDFRGSVLQAMFKPRLDYPSMRSYRGWPNERVGSSAPPAAETIEPLRTLGYIK